MELKDLDAVVEEKLRTMLYQYIKDSGVPVHFDILVHQVSRNLGKLKSTDEAHKITLKIVGSKNSKVTRLKNKTGYWDIIRDPVENEKKQTNENPEKTENSEQEKKTEELNDVEEKKTEVDEKNDPENQKNESASDVPSDSPEEQPRKKRKYKKRS